MNRKWKRFWTSRVSSTLLNRRIMIIPRIRRNHSGTLGTARTYYDSFGYGELGLVKINREGRRRKGIRGGRLLGALISF